MDDTLRETLRIVFSSTRPMPAHFSSNGERRQSFCIEFEPLNAEVDHNMSATAWGATSDFLSVDKCDEENLSERQFNTVMRCGEDLMVGAFILTKLGGVSLMVEMKNVIINDTLETFGEKTENLTNILSGKQVNKYFDYCLEYGREQVV